MNVFWRKPTEPALSFIDKQIQVRFSVPPTVLSNWRQFLIDLLGEALPDHNKVEFSSVYRIYAQQIDERAEAPSPRELKLYVNGIGALHRQWSDKFPLAHLAYFYILKRNGEDIASSLRQGILPTKKALAVLGDHSKEHLAALYFNVDVAKAQELLLRTEIERALRTTDPNLLKQLSDFPDFWVVAENISIVEWAQADEPLTVLNAARAWDESGVLGMETQSEELMAVKRALRTAAESVARWPQFDETAGKGVAALFNLIPDAGFASSMMGTISSTNFEQTSAPGWIDGLVIALSAATRLNLSEAYSGGITLATNDLGFVDACARLVEIDSEANYWGLVRASSGQNTPGNLLTVVSDGKPGWEHLSTLRILTASRFELPREQLSSAIHLRLENLESMSDVPSGPLIGMLWEIRGQQGVGHNHLGSLTQQGPLMHYLKQAQSPEDRGSIVWCMFVSLYYSPEVARPSTVGNSEQGYQLLQEFLAAPTSFAGVVGPIVDLFIENNALDHLFKILESEPASRPFIKSCVTEFQDKDGIERMISPSQVVQHWDLFHEALVGRDADNSRLDNFMRRMVHDGELTSQVRQSEFAPSDALMYASVLRASEGKDQLYTQWCANYVHAMDKESWSNAFQEEGDILRLVIDLKAIGAGLRLGQGYLDALVGHSGSLMAGASGPERFQYNWPKLIDLLGDRRRLFRERLYDLSKDANGSLAQSFFRAYAEEFNESVHLSNDGQAFSRLFEPMLDARNVPGLEWSGQFLERNSNFSNDFDRQDTVEQYRERLKEYQADPNGGDQVSQAVERILGLI